MANISLTKKEALTVIKQVHGLIQQRDAFHALVVADSGVDASDVWSPDVPELEEILDRFEDELTSEDDERSCDDENCAYNYYDDDDNDDDEDTTTDGTLSWRDLRVQELPKLSARIVSSSAGDADDGVNLKFDAHELVVVHVPTDVDCSDVEFDLHTIEFVRRSAYVFEFKVIDEGWHKFSVSKFPSAWTHAFPIGTYSIVA